MNEKKTAFSNTIPFSTLTSTVETAFSKSEENGCVRREGDNSCRAGKPLPVVATAYSRRGYAPSAKGLLLISSLLLAGINEGNSGFYSEISRNLRVQPHSNIKIKNKQTNKENTLGQTK